MSDFFKKMKSVFLEPTGTETELAEDISQDNPENGEKKDSGQLPTSKTPSEQSTHYSDVSGQQSDQFYKVLFDALERNNQAGFDYLEFRKALQSLETIGLDEKTKFLSAFAGAQASGANVKLLTDSATIYLEIL
ncbi:MAG TPA: hypothetical protein PKZ91_09640, partial [Saprospiraceae bacterium]|nr:hypothetical protein [Saprospiraceae bacterium]